MAANGSNVEIDSKLLGWNLHVATKSKLAQFEKMMEEHYIWVQEIVVEAKQTFATAEIKLLPKTPSSKAAHQRLKQRRSSLRRLSASLCVRSSTGGNETGRLPSRTCPRRATKKNNADDSTATEDTATADSDGSQRSTRSTRAGKLHSSTNSRNTRTRKRQLTEETIADQTQGEPPIINLEDSLINKNIDMENNKCNNSKESIVSDKGKEKVKNKSQSFYSPITAKVSQIEVMKENVVNSSFGHNTIIISSPEKKNATKMTPTRLVKSPMGSRFSYLKVRDKVQIFEELVNTSVGDCSPLNKSRNILSTHDIGNCGSNSCSPTVLPSKPSTPHSHASHATLTLAQPASDIDNNKEVHSDDVQKSDISNEVYIRKSSLHRTSLIGKSISASKRRSSVIRHKMRQSQIMAAGLSKQAKQELNESLASPNDKLKVQPVIKKRECSPSIRSTRSKARQISTSPVIKKRECSPSIRSTRSKARQISTSTPDSCSLVKATRSKLRVNKGSHFVINTDSPAIISVETPKAAVRTTRSKMRLNKVPPPTLDVASTDEESVTPVAGESNTRQAPAPFRSTRSKMRKNQRDGSQSPAKGEACKQSKRSGSLENSPAKKLCHEQQSTSDSEGDEELYNEDKYRTPNKHNAKIIKPIIGSGRKPSNIVTGVHSFIARSTTPAKVDLKVQIEARRQQLANKEQQGQSRLNSQRQAMVLKAEERRRKREQRQEMAMQRRLERERQQQEQSKCRMKKYEKVANKAMEDRVKDEREKQRLREKKMLEAERRRKQEDEMRYKKLQEQEEEQRKVEEMMRRKREHEERERQKRIQEQRLVDEQRRAALEADQMANRCRAFQAEEQQRQEEAERQRVREERDRREKAERERQELERLKERERLKLHEMERKKEQERKRIAEERVIMEESKRQQMEERKAQMAIEKHNHALKQNTSLNTSCTSQSKIYSTTSLNNSKLNTTIEKVSTANKPSSVLNSTFNKEAAPSETTELQSYVITPAKKYLPATEFNYDISDIKSDDSTDEEDKPRKEIPKWAKGTALRAHLISQFYRPPDIDSIFDVILPPDLNAMFKKRKARFNKRTSSAIWDSPILKPSGKLPDEFL